MLVTMLFEHRRHVLAMNILRRFAKEFNMGFGMYAYTKGVNMG
jgi:hypothetical protein